MDWAATSPAKATRLHSDVRREADSFTGAWHAQQEDMQAD